MKFSGVYTALITPFLDNGALDEEGLRQNIRFQIQSGVAGIVPLGTTGETPTLSSDEEKKILKIAIDEAKGKVQIIVGTGSNSTLKTIENTKRARDAGADAALIVTPYYNRPSQNGLIKHFEAINHETKFPFLTYNIPGRTGTMIETKTLQKISYFEHCFGVKEATGNISNMSEVIETIAKQNPRFQVLSGDDGLTLPLIALGGCGVISVASNLCPSEVVQMVELALQGKLSAARELHYKLAPLVKALFAETNPVPVKFAMKLSGMAAGTVRLPLCELTEQNQALVKKAVEDFKQSPSRL